MSLDVRKTYKMYLGGEFVRSESGRYDEALDRKGQHLADVCRGSRKDVRDAVVKARAAPRPLGVPHHGWTGRGSIVQKNPHHLHSRGGLPKCVSIPTSRLSTVSAT